MHSVSNPHNSGMTLADAQALAELHMEAHGLLRRGWRFKFHNADRRLGACWTRRKVISLSRSYVALNPGGPR